MNLKFGDTKQHKTTEKNDDRIPNDEESASSKNAMRHVAKDIDVLSFFIQSRDCNLKKKKQTKTKQNYNNKKTQQSSASIFLYLYLADLLSTLGTE